MATQISNPPEVQKKTFPKSIWWLLWILVAALFVLGGILLLGSEKRGPGMPIGGLMETPEEIAAYNAMVSRGEKSPPPISKELLSSTSDFNFDNKEIRFNVGERMKIILLEPGKTSPRIVIPNGPSWDLKEIDSTEVWLKSGVKYMDTPRDNHRIQEREFRLTGRNPVTILVHW